MAIARGAGTEIIRSIHLEQVTDTAKPMIFGVRHHIYTVLSVIVHAAALNAAGDWITMYMNGYDSNAGTGGENIFFFRQEMNVEETYVWNDKFSFNGYEPVDHAGGGAASEAIQDAIADQLVSGDSNRNVLYIDGEHGSDNFDVTCTFIDQNNA